MRVNPPYWILLGARFPPELCAGVVTAAGRAGWQNGTYETGARRDNVSVCFLRGEDDDAALTMIGAIRADCARLSGLLEVSATVAALDSVQVSKWEEGDHYGEHCDHDASRKHLGMDRKISYFVQLEGQGGLGIRKIGDVRCNVGDALVFTGLVSHWAPVQKAGRRISLAAWVPGPNWS